MNPRLFALAAVLAATAGLVLGCGGNKPSPGEKPNTNSGAPGTETEGKAASEITSLLYPTVKAPEYTPTVARREPIVIGQATVSYEERQVISAEVDGTLELIATPISEEEAKKLGNLVLYHPRDPKPKKTPLKRIGESDEVQAGQILAFFDDQQVDARIKGSKAIKVAAETALRHATNGAELAQKRVEVVQKSVDNGVGSLTDLIDAQLTLARFRENESQAIQTIAKTTSELEEATVMLDKHRVKCRVVNGIIRSIAKRPGEYVKAGEKIMEIEATDRVRIEGNLDVQYAPFVRRGMEVTVEPAVPSAPVAYHTGHRQGVTGVAVTAGTAADKRKPGQTLLVPLVVSVGADGAALVWEPNLAKDEGRPIVPHNLPHPVGVRSVIATPPSAKSVLVVTGADDGKLRIWDASNADKLPTTPKVEPQDAHAGAVHALALSPDGRFFASASGRDVFVWNLAEAKKLYALPAEHRDNITAVSFTPQGWLITASKDGSLKVWKLGNDRAAVIRTIDHRAGAVETLGVSRDGARVMFDQDKGRMDLVDPANGQTVGQVQNVSSAGSFSTLAIFGPDEVPAGTPADKLPPYSIATAGGDGDLKGALQYWHAPRTGGRGAEVGRLITPGRAPITSAAFCPVRNEPFVVVGTSAGGVYLWKPPTEARQAYTGKVTFIDATDTRYVTVRVEMNNSALKLLDKSAATIIIPAP